jgi:CoA-dependent NAD(P)H sulfur oxidoreductase
LNPYEAIYYSGRLEVKCEYLAMLWYPAVIKKFDFCPIRYYLLFMNKKHYDFLIIGGDAAGLSAAVQIRSADTKSSIGILEKGEIISYGSCGLPYAIQGIIPDFDDLIHFTPKSFSAQYHIDVMVLTEAVSVDFKEKTVTTVQTGESQEKNYLTYNKLLIATGAAPVKLSQLDYRSGLIFSLKSVTDGRMIRKFTDESNPCNIIIIGSGYIGLEMADVMITSGKKVTILDMEKEPLSRMPGQVRETVKKKFTDNKIEFFGETEILSSRKDEKINQIILITNRGEFRADMVIAATGIKPVTEFLDSTELKMNRGAIEVDQRGLTSIPDVFAAGDCAMVYHKLLDKNVYMPLGSTANKQGRIAGQNMAGITISFPGIIGTQVFKFFDIAIAKTGLSEEEAKSAGMPAVTVSADRPSKAGYYPGAVKISVTLTIHQETGVILGGLYIGPVDSAVMIDTAGVMAQSKMQASEIAYFDSAYAPPVAPVWNALISAAGKFGREPD